MSRKRMLSPDIWTDDGFLSLTIPERLLFIGLVSHADDDGRGCADPRTLKAKVFPADDMPAAELEAMCLNMERHVKVVFYEVGGTRYYQLERWQNHQSIKDKRTSTIPPRDLPGTSPEPPRDTPVKEGRKEKKEKKEKKEGEGGAKRLHAPRVEMTDEEHQKLVAEYGAFDTSEAIQFLSEYKADKPYKNKSDYLTIRRWVVNAVRERRLKASKSGSSPPGAVVFKGRTCKKCGNVQTDSMSYCSVCHEDLPRRAG
jgi:hypothetical protein